MASVAQQQNNPNLQEIQIVKHPLMHAWTLWYFDHDRNKSWEQNQHAVSTFNTVEDFWSLFTHIKQPSEVNVGSDYSLFKENIRPMWEDKGNKNGGRWMLTMNRAMRAELDRYWIDTVLCLIGEAFESFNETCGAVVNLRPKGDKIAIWTADHKNKEAVMEIGKKVKEGLNLPDNIKMHYQTHADSMVKNSSSFKFLYEV